ncbi:hypothetical protein [Spongiactinospora sp. TRM90649]|uniref:hypothetical protein n=1 Tax=Spongiactinospora sp. TRM90649 TaxID=3031114 RepID=UPI0023F78AA8|nr:hypothetical protein [Spongiactinospora sp. TRM90649]MDF5756972.1 hypothetical protein [Spongiactinospora sp. TRM90649]
MRETVGITSPRPGPAGPGHVGARRRRWPGRGPAHPGGHLDRGRLDGALPGQAKRLIDDGVQQALGAALTTEQAALSRLFATTADAAEGIEAFAAKHEPVFCGR